MNTPGQFKRQKTALGLLCLSALALTGGCAVNSSTGRSQLIALPAAQVAHADIGFAIAAATDGLAPSSSCGTDPRLQAATSVLSGCPNEENRARFAHQVKRLGEGLARDAREFAPDLFTRISMLDIAVETGMGAGTASSAGGRIVLGADLAALDPTDDVVAFLIAREIGHVIARHGEEDSGARMTFSAITALVPIGGLIVKLATSYLASQALMASWADGQRREADELALALLERGGRSPAMLALNLQVGFRRELLQQSQWSTHIGESIARVAALAAAPAERKWLAIADLK